MTNFHMRRLFDEAVAYGLFDNIDAEIANCESLAEIANDDRRDKWLAKAQEWKQLKADAELQRAVNNYRESGK